MDKAKVATAFALKGAKVLLPYILSAVGGFVLATYPHLHAAFCQVV